MQTVGQSDRRIGEAMSDFEPDTVLREATNHYPPALCARSIAAYAMSAKRHHLTARPPRCCRLESHRLSVDRPAERTRENESHRADQVRATRPHLLAREQQNRVLSPVDRRTPQSRIARIGVREGPVVRDALDAGAKRSRMALTATGLTTRGSAATAVRRRRSARCWHQSM